MLLSINNIDRRLEASPGMPASLNSHGFLCHADPYQGPLRISMCNVENEK